MTQLPTFTLDGYAELLLRLKALGYALHPASDIARVTGRAVFLRHDVDLHLEGALDVAAVEGVLGARSTWYVGTRLAYNPAFEPNAEVIRALASHGHTVGLHYVGDQVRLESGMVTLEDITDVPVDTWVMHEPSSRAYDWHMRRGIATVGNPHAYGLHYVSDSGMRWRDPWIGALLAGEPERVMLNTHHEHWIGNGQRRDVSIDSWFTAHKPLGDYMRHLLKGYAD